ncbi:MAG: DNA cytosine methyltransferase [Candidatus Cloacimonetes bacterium]|jgi:DNA (cytosine-5)-methyltransferase 1|nr:DNA cytosine methyltransferase [Candidatus Cloacimonadota bacterium]
MKFVDLFAGCGGMSLGFEMAGFKNISAVEMDSQAAETYKANRVGKKPPIVADIRDLSPFDLGITGLSNLMLVGGPPCQGLSLAGNRDPKDPRNSLFMEFLRIADNSSFSCFVAENVKGILSMKTAKGEPLTEIILSEASKCGYNTKIWVLNAHEFAVPQSRTRVFFVGTRENREIYRPEPVLSRWSVWDAISDLPEIEAGSGTDFQEYPSQPSNLYQRWARSDSKGVFNHIAMRHTKRLIERFKAIQQGNGVGSVSEEHSQRKRGDASCISGKVFSQNNYRVFPDKPCPTIAASFQSNFIHPYKDRNFTAREAARMQSFPDRYVFKGKRTKMSWEKGLSQYQQIGNAVPPLLAKAIAESFL